MADSLEERTISLEGAQKVLRAALDRARELQCTVSVAVGGRGGELRAFASMDGASRLSGETARRKVNTVAMTRMSTHEFGRILKEEMAAEPELFHGMLGIEGMLAIAGGVAIKIDGQLIGAVAVSGGSSAEDQQIAEHAALTIRS